MGINARQNRAVNHSYKILKNNIFKKSYNNDCLSKLIVIFAKVNIEEIGYEVEKIITYYKRSIGFLFVISQQITTVKINMQIKCEYSYQQVWIFLLHVEVCGDTVGYNKG